MRLGENQDKIRLAPHEKMKALAHFPEYAAVKEKTVLFRYTGISFQGIRKLP